MKAISELFDIQIPENLDELPDPPEPEEKPKRRRPLVLKMYTASVEVFYRILDEFEGKVVVVDNLDDYYKGYADKQTIYYDGYDRLICLEYILDYCAGGCLKHVEEWKQVVVRMSGDINMKPVIADITGTYAWTAFNKILSKEYSPEEVKEQLHKFEAEHDDCWKQYHYNITNEPGIINVHENAYCYDINGAHADALAEIFPRCDDKIEKMYRERKKHPNNKAIFNYFVGILCRKGYRKTYNWIVQRTTMRLFDAMDYTDGLLIYANTDGFITKDPRRKLKTSKALGQFKLEYHGTVYTYSDVNYTVTQYGKKMKGNLRLMLRDKVDLSQGKVVHYKTVRKGNVPHVMDVTEEQL